MDENFVQTRFGYCFYDLETYPLIYNLYVHPEHRRCGHSKRLLQWVISEIRRTGYTGEISIEAFPKENSINLEDLVKYYESIGLKVTEKGV